METTTKQLSFIERLQEAAARRNDNMTTLTNDQKCIIRDIKTLRDHILEGYPEKMRIANSMMCRVGDHDYPQHYAVLWDSSSEMDTKITHMDINKIMSYGYTSELPEGHKYNRNFLSILQSGLPPDHKIYISCKYVVYMFWKMDMFADRIYRYCVDHMVDSIARAIENGFDRASVWSMKYNANVIPELIGSDIDALLRHKYKTSENDGRLTIAQRLQALLDTEEYNNGYDSTTGNKLTVGAIYGMPMTKKHPFQIVIWRKYHKGINLNSDK